MFCWPCITSLFEHTNVEISFRNTNTLQQLTKPKTHNKVLEQDKSGIYKIMCNTCHVSYIGQTSHSLKQKYKEHIRHIKHNEPQSAHALHILNNKHKYGHIKDTMTLLNHTDKLTLLIPYKQLYIQTYHHHKKLIPEQHINEHKLMFQLIYNLYNTSHPTD
jgi:phosphoribulokinase